jgi:two-component sensor histidine kinase
MGKNLSLVLPEGRTAEMQPLIEKVQRGQRIEHYEIERKAKDGQTVQIAFSLSPVKDETDKVIGAALIARDISERRRADELHALMLDELNHRVKNTLATVQAIAAQSFQGEGSDAQRREIFEARLIALSGAHNLLTRENWEGVSLRDLLLQELQPYHATDTPRFQTRGPDIRLTPKAAVALAMAFHELATNAAKYGAFSTPTGKVDVVWGLQKSSPHILRLIWTETGGPKVTTPVRKGFGSRLIERGLSLELDGRVQLDFNPSGLVCTIGIPFPSAAEGIDAT